MKNQRNRAYRRFKNRIKKGKGQGTKNICKPEKKWKMIYIRTNKILRAKQLGFEYPRRKLIDFVDQECDINE